MNDAFHITDTPLAPGVTLLEASAGTGKTFAIAGLYLRHLVANELQVGELLVVTFTRAATAELRRRIRNLLALARRIAEGRPDGGNPDAALVREILKGRDMDKMRALFRLALESFETAPVCTIDSFCQRALQEHAFVTRTLFDAEFAADVTEARRSVVDDFWRERFYVPEGSLRARLADIAGLKQEDLQTVAGRALNQAAFEIVPEPAADPTAARQKLETDIQGRTTEEGYLEDAAGKPSELFVAQAAEWVSLLKIELLHEIRDRLTGKLERDRRLTFGDLRQRLADALRGPHGQRLVATIRKRLRVALIDEFQDTDPVQFEMFSRLFGDVSSGHYLYLVGDPKQAIYSFRGADVFAYLGASETAARRFTLPANWRSERMLVNAVNHLFDRGENPFVIPEIRFQPVDSRGRAEKEPFIESGGRRPPLRIEYWEPGDDAGTKDAQQEFVAQYVADGIAAMLSDAGTGFLREDRTLRRLRPGDVAVLISTHNEAALVESALRTLGVATVRQTRERIFATAEAAQLLRVIKAAAGPADDRVMRAAAASSLLGWSAVRLDAIEREPAAWLALLRRFREYAVRWERQGFLAAWEMLCDGEEVRARFLRLPDGERRFTNLVHLAEVLQHAASAGRLGRHALVEWLERNIADPAASEDDEHLLRLDRDDEAVKLVTIHTSKGLEYPVVICPFLFEPFGRKSDKTAPVAFHDPADGWKLKLDVSVPGGQQRGRAEQLSFGEDFAEKLRLIYVALTRARNRCHVVWGPLKRRNGGVEKSPLGWLLHPLANAANIPPGDAIEALKKHLKPEKEIRELRSELEDIVEGAPDGCIELHPLAETQRPTEYRPAADTAAQPRFVPEPFTGAIDTAWRVTSYSSLSGHSRETPEADTEPETLRTGPMVPDPFRGVGAGNALHAVLERLPLLAGRETELPGLVETQLRANGFDPDRLKERLLSLVRHTLASPLAATRRHDDDPDSIDAVPMSAWRMEVPFHLPLRLIKANRLSEIAARHRRPGDWSAWPESLAALGFEPVHGYLTGKIDLVFSYRERFHIVDWKSNVVGPSPEDYTPEAVFDVMLRSQYLLQYHLYLLALDRHLRRRIAGYDYDRHFGGAWYLFVRGMDPAHPGRGVFYDRPSAEFIRELGEAIIDDSRLAEPAT